MGGVIDRLEAVIREHVRDEMHRHVLGELYDGASGELDAMAFPELLVTYGTWRSRLIPAQARRCHVSSELRSSPKAVEHEAVLDTIVAKIEAGDDLRAHLSKGTDHVLEVDRMLADLGVHHLHLSVDLEANGRFLRRGTDLLFTAFKPGDAYLVGVYQHATDWARREILETIARNWPDGGIIHQLRYTIGLKHDFNDQERLELQQAGISANAIEVDGKVFATVGQSLAGSQYVAQQLRMTVVHVLGHWREHLAERLEEAARAVNAAAGREVDGNWEPLVHEGYAGFQREDVFHGIVPLS